MRFHPKRYILPIFMSITPIAVNAAQIYITNYPSEASAKVFVTKYRSEANCIVYETQYASDNEPGVWFYTKYRAMLAQQFITPSTNQKQILWCITQNTKVMRAVAIKE